MGDERWEEGGTGWQWWVSAESKRRIFDIFSYFHCNNYFVYVFVKTQICEGQKHTKIYKVILECLTLFQLILLILLSVLQTAHLHYLISTKPKYRIKTKNDQKHLNPHYWCELPKMTEGENEMCIEFSDWLLSYVLTQWWQSYNLYCNQPTVSVCL